MNYAEVAARIHKLDIELVRVRQIAQRADDLADECVNPLAYNVLRDEADNLWYAAKCVEREIEQARRTLAEIVARDGKEYWERNRSA